jgi:hypothetical protein
MTYSKWCSDSDYMMDMLDRVLCHNLAELNKFVDYYL